MEQITNRDVARLTEWFYQGKYGVMLHFLGDLGSSDEEWNDRVNAFDCQTLAKQLNEVGANHLIFTTTQCGGRFCMPIDSYSQMVKEAGITKNLCSTRDLISDLYDALSPYGINLILYTAAEAGITGELRKKIFTWDPEFGPQGDFKKNWSKIFREISLRYGKKVKGWWVDGCNAMYSVFQDLDSTYSSDMADVLRAGNPDSIIAYNPGIMVKKVSNAEDYTCGESDFLVFYPKGRFIDGIQWHVLTYLGISWLSRLSVRSNIELVNYAKTCTDNGGVLTFNVFYNPDGTIAADHFAQLMVLRHFIKDVDSFELSEIPESKDYLANMASLPHLDKIPENWTNIALGKPTQASSYWQGVKGITCKSELITDGNPDTGWAPADSGVEGAWCQIDLGKEERIDGIELAVRNERMWERRLFEIRVSNNPDFSSFTTILAHGEFPLPIGQRWTKIVEPKVTGRYVRYQSMPGGSAFVSEMCVYADK